MNLLYTLIAFSIIMIVSSTLVVALVRLLHEVRGMRRRHMRYLVGAFFDEYLWPNFGRLVSDLDPKLHRAGKRIAGKPVEEELSPTRGFFHHLFGALDLWAIFWQATGWRRRHNEDSADAQAATSGWHTAGIGFTVLVVWAVVVGLCALLMSAGLGIVILFFIVIAVFGIDRTREVDRERFAVWNGLDKLTVRRLKWLEEVRGTDGTDWPPTLDTVRQASQTQQADHPRDFDAITEVEFAGLLDQHERLTRRRGFIDEILKVSNSMAAGQGRSDTAGREDVSVIDIAAHLGRTEFGEAIQRAAASRKDKTLDEVSDTLTTMLDDLARRFDGLGQESSANFRDIARKWSVGLAFIVAVAANVDAPHLLKTLYENPELSQRIDAEFGEKVEAMSREMKTLLDEIEQKRAAEAEREEGQTDAELQEAKEGEIAALEKRFADTKEKFKSTTSDLADLGVPIGWEFFPYCVQPEPLTVSDTPPDQQFRDDRCNILLQGARSYFTAKAKSEDKDFDGHVALRYRELLNLPDRAQALKDARTACAKEPNSLISRVSTCSGYGITNAKNYLGAGWVWFKIRLEHGLALWMFGVLLGGALIGLGGPFWFDIYKRISAVAQVARAAGLTARRKPTETSAEPATAPEVVHQPKDVHDAFKNSIRATQQTETANKMEQAFATFATLAEQADETGEVPAKVTSPRVPLDRSGDPA